MEQSIHQATQKSRSVQFIRYRNGHEKRDNPYSQIGTVFKAAGWQKFFTVKFTNSVNLLGTVVEISLSLFLRYFIFIKENKNSLSLKNMFSLEVEVLPGSFDQKFLSLNFHV